MKKIILAIAVTISISGCDSNNFLEKIGLKERVTTVIQFRGQIAYLPNENEPFTGKIEEYANKNTETFEVSCGDEHENKYKIQEASFKNGKQNGLATSWYQNGQKQSEENWIDGSPDGLKAEWEEDGVKK
ncbi:MAG: toxin-antitoxin system YwqK family antitoxin [Methylobacter sp.]